MNRARAKRPIRKDVSEISPIIKYLLFGFNVIFWVIKSFDFNLKILFFKFSFF